MKREIKDILDKPVFIVGVPRSGTTWVQRILLAHPQVCSAQESHFFKSFAPVLRSFRRGKRSHRRAGLYWYWDEADFDRELTTLWYKTMDPIVRKHTQATILVEKTPDHGMFISEIARLLPNARFINAIRDSRAVVASLLAASREEWGKRWAPKTAIAAAQMWQYHLQAARRQGRELPSHSYREVFYEDLLADTPGQAKALFDFIGLAVSEEELNAIENKLSFSSLSSVSQASAASEAPEAAQKPLPPEPKGFFRKGKADSWKNDLSPWQKLVIWRQTQELMRECGYSWRGRETR